MKFFSLARLWGAADVEVVMILIAFGSIVSGCSSYIIFPETPKNEKQIARCIEHGWSDYNRVLSGREPRHAVFTSAYSDGGTIEYYGGCYELTSFKRTVEDEGRRGDLVGPRIEWDRRLIPNSTENQEEVHFVPYSQED
ncbi:MAG: hypothetical protein MK135_15865 [Polyangiaceae bacterium]|nr:hypothetical protein [Polyangiaceae bacterium]